MEILNEKRLCPFRKRVVVNHKMKSGTKVFSDIYATCLECRCMAYDKENQKCLKLSNYMRVIDNINENDDNKDVNDKNISTEWVRKHIPTEINENDDYYVAFVCTTCGFDVPVVSEYCPHCGQKHSGVVKNNKDWRNIK